MVGETVSHYHIVGKLGGGGMGLVYDAEDTRLGRHVALKFIPENLVNDRKALERFEREAKAASQLNHPGICTIYDIEDMNGQPFIVMEKLEGMSLKDRLRGTPMDIEEMLDIAIQVSRCAGRLPRQRDHSSRHQAGEHLYYPDWAGQDPGLRTGQVVARSVERRARKRRSVGGRRHLRYRGLYVAGAGARRRAGCPQRSVFARRGALPDGDWPETICRRQLGGHVWKRSSPRSRSLP